MREIVVSQVHESPVEADRLSAVSALHPRYASQRRAIGVRTIRIARTATRPRSVNSSRRHRFVSIACVVYPPTR